MSLPRFKNRLICLAALACIGLVCAQEKVVVGTFKTQFKEHSPLSNAKDLQKRADVKDDKDVVGTHDYRLKNENFLVYVPDDYRPWKPFGIVVWIDPQDEPRLPPTYPAIFKERNLIWISAEKCGAEQDVHLRKMPLALDAVHNLKKIYNIDPTRIYTSGLASGSRAACRTAIMYPEVFKGGVFLFGVEYWGKVKVPSNSKSAWPASFAKPKSRILRQIKSECRYAVINSGDWANTEYVQAVSENGLGPDLKGALSYRNIEGLGLAYPKAKDYAKAFDDVDSRLRVKAADWIEEAAVLIKEQNDYQKAMALYFRAARLGSKPGKKALEIHLATIGAATAKGRELIAKDDFAAAAKILEGTIDTYGPYLTAAAQVELAKIPDHSAKPKSGSAQGYLDKAKAYYKKKDKKNTIKYLKRVVSRFPDTPQAKEAAKVLKKLTK